MTHLTSRAVAGTPVGMLALAPDRRRATALLAALALVLAIFVSGAATARPAGAGTVEDTFTGKLNQARTSRGIPALTPRSHLVSIARAQAGRMADQSRLYHNPNLTSDVNNWRWVGENVGYGPTSLAVHLAFMNSPAHKANILDRDYSEIGIGAVVRGGRVWVAQVFRAPARVTTSSVRSVSAVASFDHTLRLTSRGAAVQRVQGRLGLRKTGYYDHGTLAAVSRFQRAQGWQGRGNCGPKTWSLLF